MSGSGLSDGHMVWFCGRGVVNFVESRARGPPVPSLMLGATLFRPAWLSTCNVAVYLPVNVLCLTYFETHLFQLQVCTALIR